MTNGFAELVPASGSVPAGCGVGLFPSWMDPARSQIDKERFFAQFLLAFDHIRSISLAFYHSLNTVFPHTPHHTVAENVVNRSRLEPASVQAGSAFSLSCTRPIQALQVRRPHRLQLKIYGAINNIKGFSDLPANAQSRIVWSAENTLRKCIESLGRCVRLCALDAEGDKIKLGSVVTDIHRSLLPSWTRSWLRPPLCLSPSAISSGARSCSVIWAQIISMGSTGNIRSAAI